MTLRTLAGLLDRFEEAGGAAFRLQFVTPINTPPVTTQGYVTFIKTFYERPLNENRRRIEDSIFLGYCNGINGGNCGRNLRTIDPDGTVYVCPDLAGQGLFPLGNILLEDAQALIGQEKMFFDRERKLALECKEGCVNAGGCLLQHIFMKATMGPKDHTASLSADVFLSETGSSPYMRDNAAYNIIVTNKLRHDHCFMDKELPTSAWILLKQ
jgi:radical SAM protein with 4Fe4S-binding SPASM domain